VVAPYHLKGRTVTKTEATAQIRQTLEEILIALGDDFDKLEDATNDALNQIYYEQEEVVTN
jgi:hypothetical protein